MQKQFLLLTKNLNLFLIVFVAISISGCKTTYTPSYFNDVSNNADTLIKTNPSVFQPSIKVGDALLISLVTLDELSGSQVYQAPVSGNVPEGNTTLNTPSGNNYVVDNDGYIDAPLIGRIQVSGLTLIKAKEKISAAYSGYYKSFSLNVGFANHKVTILGEVNHPGTFSLPASPVSIYDALGYAGDITVFGKKDNVALLRDSGDNQKHLVRLDLNSRNIITSPYYYLRDNDVVYIEPSRAKLASTDAYRNRNLAIYTTALSVVLIVLSRLAFK